MCFLSDEMHLPNFEGCHATINFIKIIDKTFDILNSRVPWAFGYKAPLKLENESTWRPFLTDVIDYLANLTDVGGKHLWKTPKKTPFLGFITSIKSFISMFDYWVRERNYLKYLLT